VLVDRGQILLESVAILAYLADSFIEKGLAPPTGSAQRGLYYQWLFYSTATLERHVKQLVLQTIKLPAGERSESAASTSRKELECCAQYLESCLKDRPFIMGVQFSAADIALSHWMKTMRDELGLLGQCPHALAYLDSILSRPALLRASMP
jgi:glutathione S-transferase